MDSRRDGFSLLEVTLALALAGALLLGLWSAMSLQMRLFTREPIDVERAQLVRAVAEQLADDLQGVLPPRQPHEMGGPLITSMVLPAAQTPSPATSGQDPFSDSGDSRRDASLSTSPPMGGNQRMSAVSPESQGALPVAHLVGDEASLRLEVLVEPLPPLLPSSDGSGFQPMDRSSVDRPATLPATGLKSVFYALQESSPARDPFAEGVITASGLIRYEVPWGMSVDTEPFAEQSPAEGDTAITRVPEVTGLRFRYFDGSQWTSQWDSQQRGTLPVAVEAWLEFADENSGAGGREKRARRVSSAHDPSGPVPPDATVDGTRAGHRLVVFLGTAARPDPTDSLSGLPASLRPMASDALGGDVP
jgi:hypothetical protein